MREDVLEIKEKKKILETQDRNHILSFCVPGTSQNAWITHSEFQETAYL